MNDPPISEPERLATAPPAGVGDRAVRITAWLVFACAVAMIIPLVMTSFLGDDIYDSVVNGVTAHTGQSLSQFVLAVNWGILKSNGRLQMPALFQYFGIFAAVPNLLAYKALQIVFVLLNLATFYVFLRSLRVAALTSLVIVAVAIATLQIRVYHDPILGFSILYQVMLEFNLISFALFARYCRQDRLIDLAASALFFFFALFYYETSYPLGAVHVFIAVRLKGWSAWRTATPFLILSAFFFGLSLAVRHFINMTPDAMYRLSLDPSIYLLTLAKQMLAAVPLSYLYFVGPQLFGSWWHAYDSAPWFVLLSVAIIGAGAIAVPLLNGRSIFRSEFGLGKIAMIGAALWILSAALLATLPRYQLELRFGLGYLPVYFEDFGVALVLGSALVALLRVVAHRANRWQWRTLSIALALAFAFALSLTYGANAYVINTFAGEKYGRAALSAAIQDGMLRRLSGGDTLFINGVSESVRHFGGMRDAKYFLRQATGLNVNAIPVDSIYDYFHCRQVSCSAKTAHAFVMVSNPLDARTGSAIVGRIAGVTRVVQGGVPTITPVLEDVELFVSGPQLGIRSRSAGYSVTWQVTGCDGKAGFQSRTVPLDRLADVRSGNEWRIVQLPKSCGAVALASLGIYSGPE